MKLLILGGDKRQELLCEILSREHTVSHYFTEEDLNRDFSEFDTVILPLPSTKDGKNLFNPLGNFGYPLENIDKKITHQRVLAGGKVPIKNSVDYKSEMLLMMNAVPTAEAALALAILNTDKTLQESRCLITGNGRIGKILADRLSAFTSEITVSARKESDFAYISAFGHKPINTADIKDCINDFDIIFNTIPVRIFDKDTLKRCRKDTVLIELASAPYGFDSEIAQSLGLKVIPAPALPGKTAPATAANI
ncbi:MAG: hypothetical protein KBS52_06285 [Clostridiales bacterium]|nr:hypothetical protein [Candidatus Equinaster intestinalis]